MNDHDKDKLWELLGQAKPVEPSPFFARNVVRAARQTKRERAGVFGWLLDHWPAPVLGGAAAMLIALISVRSPAPHNGQLIASNEERELSALALEVTQSAEFQVIENLDELIATQQHAVWLENPTLY